MNFTSVNLSARIEPYEVDVNRLDKMMETITMSDRWQINIEVTGPKCSEAVEAISQTAMKFNSVDPAGPDGYYTNRDQEYPAGPDDYYANRNQMFSAAVVVASLTFCFGFLAAVVLFKLCLSIGG